jgi:chemotaxis protein methyltransferase CheR
VCLETLSQHSSLALLRDLIEEKIGFHYPDSQLDILEDKLGPRHRQLHLSSPLDYYYYLKYDSDAASEWTHLITALVVPETFFHREYDPIRWSAEAFVPQRLSQNQSRAVRIWHAACSSGEEPYSMAIALSEAGIPPEQVDIVATDLDEYALLRARQGLYGQRSLRSLPAAWQKYFEKRGSNFLLSADIRRRVRFQVLNLLERPRILELGRFDLIFCRNVFIYFKPAAIEEVVHSLAQVLNPGGRLFVGACESLLRYVVPVHFDQEGGFVSYRLERP